MNSIKVNGYNLNYINLESNKREEKKIYKEIKYSSYADLINKMKKIWKDENLEHLDTEDIALFIKKYNDGKNYSTIIIKLGIDPKGNTIIRKIQGNIFNEEMIEEKFDEELEKIKNGDDSAYLDTYANSINRGDNLRVSFEKWCDDLTKEDVLYNVESLRNNINFDGIEFNTIDQDSWSPDISIKELEITAKDYTCLNQELYDYIKTIKA